MPLSCKGVILLVELDDCVYDSVILTCSREQRQIAYNVSQNTLQDTLYFVALAPVFG